MRIMTSNIWGDYFDNPVGPRVEPFAHFFHKEAPDILGLQEYNQSWHNSCLLECLSDRYDVVGLCADRINYTPLLYCRSTLTLESGGWILYDETPDESKGFTWAILKCKADGKKLLVCNTHFWWKIGPEHDALRCKNAAQLAAFVKQMCGQNKIPAVIIGDLNTTVDTMAMDILLKAGFELMLQQSKNADMISSHHGDPWKMEDGTFVGQRTHKDWRCSIDHMLSYRLNAVVVCYRIVQEQNVLNITDHSPVYADIQM